MTYGNKIYLIIFISLFCIFITGCKPRNSYYELYDGFMIKKTDEEIKLYKDMDLIKIHDLDYKIKEFKYNSDVVCLKLESGDYYMIYYVDGNIYGPFTKESLDTSVSSLSMTFDNDFRDIEKADGLIYE